MANGKKKELLEIPLTKLVQKENTRGDYRDAEIASLMTSMKQHGLLEPVGVRKINGHWEVVCGNRRVVAASKLGWEFIEAVEVAQHGSKENDIDFYVKNAAENMQRVDPSFAEQGRIFNKLIRMGLNIEEIAARVGVHRSRVGAILGAYDRIPKYLKHKVKLDLRGTSKKEDEISLKNAQAVITTTKTYKLPAGTQEKLFEYAKKPGVTKPQISQAGRLMAAGASFKSATNYLGSVKVISAIKEVEQQFGMKVRDAIYQFVAKSGEFPLARISNQVYKPTRAYVRKKGDKNE